MEATTEEKSKTKKKIKKPEIKPKEVVKKSPPADSIDVPNHMAPVHNSEMLPFPELYLMRSDGSSSSTGLLFVDEKHKIMDWWSRDAKAPPTWMDPCVLTAMAFKNEEIRKTLEKAAKANSRDRTAALDKQLEELFIKQYLVYALKEFRKVKEPYKQWLLARYVANERSEKTDVSDQGSGVRDAADAAGRNGGAGSGKAKRRRLRRPAGSEGRGASAEPRS